MPKEFSVALKGALSLFIVGTHISSLCQPDETLLWLRVCNLLTPLSLVFFFFLSGYGLMIQLRLRTLRKPTTSPATLWAGWLPRRLWGLLKPFLFFYLLAVLFLFIGFGFDHIPQALAQLKVNFIIWKVGIPGPLFVAWYLLELMVLYVFFYFSFRYVRRWGRAVFVLIGLTLLLMLVAWQVGFGYYWLRYPLCFSVGVAYAIYERSIYKRVEVCRLISLAFALLLGGIYIWSVQTFPNQPLMLLITSHLAYFALPVMLTALSKSWGTTDLFMRRAHGPVGSALMWLGGISLETYLLHMSFVNYFRSPVIYIQSPLLYLVVVYTATIFGAYLIARYLRVLVRA
ncbi:acyltransferase family protein [uncultured Porphyromonas sp.]|uniref:acyltransferase family protein n=1 Tax=uncultured Porphyromonas sp. TaxID=159274 RepID=UPI002590F6B2|nr:acyltransferase family protein [uncultured Porphyromonas sp.]